MPCPTGTDVDRAARILRSGGLVAFATETVYGLGADALNAEAVARVFEAKGRPTFDPLIVHVAEATDVDRYVSAFPDAARKLVAEFWPGPLTLVLPKREIIPDLVTAGLPSVAVRIPAHELARDLIRRAGVPVAAPSANRFGGVSPTTAAHVAEQLGDKIDYLLDGGPCGVGLESTIVSLLEDRPEVLRLGGLSVEEIETVIGPVPIRTGSSDPGGQLAPGMLKRHYAPQTPLVIVERLSPDELKQGDALLCHRAPDIPLEGRHCEVLSETGDLRQSAANFFAALRRLDALRPTRIVAVRFPEEGLGRALNDRLNRAAAR